MSQENVEVVHRCFRAFTDHDLDGALANLTDDVEWRLIGGFADLMGSEFRGPEEVRSFLLELGENLGWSATPESIREAGDRAVVISDPWVSVARAAPPRPCGGARSMPSAMDSLREAMDSLREARRHLRLRRAAAIHAY